MRGRESNPELDGYEPSRLPLTVPRLMERSCGCLARFGITHFSPRIEDIRSHGIVFRRVHAERVQDCAIEKVEQLPVIGSGGPDKAEVEDCRRRLILRPPPTLAMAERDQSRQRVFRFGDIFRLPLRLLEIHHMTPGAQPAPPPQTLPPCGE